MPLLSIIIPTYNAEATIERCLKSLCSQSYKDFEVCIVDGASSDRTITIASNFRSCLDNLRIISEPDSGVYDAMNKGVNIARGEWVYFLGGDDELHSHDVLFQIFSDESNLKHHVIYGNVISSRFHGTYNGKFSADMLYRINICHQSIFVKKSIFRKLGLFNTKYKILADWEHNTRWFFNRSIRKKYVDLIIANYSDGGLSSSLNDHDLSADWYLINLRRGFFYLPTKTKIELLRWACNYFKPRNFLIYLLMTFGRICLTSVESSFSSLRRPVNFVSSDRTNSP